MPDNISYIHSNKLAKYNVKYAGKDGTIYIGQKDGRLKKQELSTSDVESIVDAKAKIRISTAAGTGSGSGSSTQDMINPFLLMGG